MLMRRRAVSERGAALAVALAITMIVAILAELVLQDAFHNVAGGGDSRDRLTAISAAEAGLAWYTHALESHGLDWLRGDAGSDWKHDSSNVYVTRSDTDVAGIPRAGRFGLKATYWNQVGLTNKVGICSFEACNALNIPNRLWVQLVSSGQAGSVVRKVAAVIAIDPVKASVEGAIGGVYLCKLGNRFTITGDGADVFLLAATNELNQSSCSGTLTQVLEVTSGQLTTTGSVFVPNGGVAIETTTKIDGSIMASGSIVLGRSGTSPNNGKGCTSRAAPVVICGDAISQTSAPTVKNAKVFGTITQCAGCAIPSPTFPIYFKSGITAPFTGNGWPTLVTPVTSLPDLSGTPPAAKEIYDFTASCSAPVEWTSAKSVWNLQYDMVVISPCGFNFKNLVQFKNVSASTAVPPTLYLLTYAPNLIGTPPHKFQVADCKSTSQLDDAFRSNFDASAIRLYVYTPCKVSFFNQINITGQIVASSVDANGNTTITTKSVAGAPSFGLGDVGSFKARVLSAVEA